MLLELADDVFVWCGGGGLEAPNAGVVVEDDGLTVIDSLLVPSQAIALRDALHVFGRPVRRLVLTSSHVPFAGGSGVFTLAAVYGSVTTSANLDLPPNTAGYQHLFPTHAAEFAALTTRRVSHIVQQPAWLSQKVVAAPLVGHQSPNLVVQVPHANVVFAGALCSFGAYPLGFEADLEAWSASLDTIVDWGAVIVPGVGPVGDADDVAALANYLVECRDAALAGATTTAGAPGWTDAAFDVVNVERAARLAADDPSPPESALRLFGMR